MDSSILAHKVEIRSMVSFNFLLDWSPLLGTTGHQVFFLSSIPRWWCQFSFGELPISLHFFWPFFSVCSRVQRFLPWSGPLGHFSSHAWKRAGLEEDPGEGQQVLLLELREVCLILKVSFRTFWWE